MQGTWTNPKTGDSFTVQDSSFMDNQYMVQTTDGRVLRYDQIQNYVQSQDGAVPQSSQPATIVHGAQPGDLPREVLDIIESPGDSTASESGSDSGILPDDAALLRGIGSGVPMDPRGIPGPGGFTKPNLYIDQSNAPIIEKALKKAEMPRIDYTIGWAKFPERELEFLKDTMEIDLDEIINFFIDKINVSNVVDTLRENLAVYIKDILAHDNGNRTCSEEAPAQEPASVQPPMDPAKSEYKKQASGTKKPTSKSKK